MVLGKRRRRSRTVSPAFNLAQLSHHDPRILPPVTAPADILQPPEESIRVPCDNSAAVPSAAFPSVDVPSMDEPSVEDQSPTRTPSPAQPPPTSRPPNDSFVPSDDEFFVPNPHYEPESDAATDSQPHPLSPDTTVDRSLDYPVVHSDFFFDVFQLPDLSQCDDGTFDAMATSESEPFDADIASLASDVVATTKKKLKRLCFLGILSLYGKTRFTLDSYDHLVTMMRDKDTGQSIPSASTMRQRVFPYLVQNLFTQSAIHKFTFKDGAVPPDNTPTTSFSHYKNEAVVVKVSDWLRMDVQSLHILREIACIDSCRCSRYHGQADLRIDSAEIVRRRTAFSQQSQLLWVNKSGTPYPAENGTACEFNSPLPSSAFTSLRARSSVRLRQVIYRGERCTSFQGEILDTLTVALESENGAASIHLNRQRTPSAIDSSAITQSLPSPSTTSSQFHACLSYIKDICRETQPTDSELAVDSRDANHEATRNRSDFRGQTRRKSKRLPSDENRSLSSFQMEYLLPSDHVTVLSIDEDRGIMGIFVSRFWTRRLDDERNFLLFLQVSSDPQSKATLLLSVPVLGVPCFISSPSSTTNLDDRSSVCNTTGKLPCGTPFYIYRVIMYADDFNGRSTLFPKGSVGGLYMTPCGLHQRSRRSQSSIRVLSLTPSGVSTNSVIDHLLDDIVSGSVEGVECVDAFGQQVRVFVDMLGFLGDYPASSAVVDVSGHQANAPCTHCSFHVSKNFGQSRYSFTTSATSGSSTHRRTQIRMRTIRKVRLNNKQRKLMGVKLFQEHHETKSGMSPLLKFADLYNDAVEKLRVGPKLKMINHLKDGYAANIIAPDHLITGLFSGILLCTFMYITDGDETHATKLETILINELAKFGYPSQTTLYIPKKRKLVPGLSMSMLYVLLSVLPSSLRSFNLLDTLPTKNMITNLHIFVSLALWWPTQFVDGDDAWDLVHGTNIGTYHTSLHTLASNFVKSVNAYALSYPDMGCHVDRPNTHRLLELTMHTLPAFTHISNVCELVFESAHQPLKYYLSRNHTSRSHIYSVQLMLARDWLVRIWCLWSIHTSTTESQRAKEDAMIGLFILLGGKKASLVDWRSASTRESFKKLNDHVNDLLSHTAESILKKWYNDISTSYNSPAYWKVISLGKPDSLSSQQSTFLAAARQRLATLCRLHVEHLELGLVAQFRRGYGSSAINSHERLKVGDFIQLLIQRCDTDAVFLHTKLCSSGLPFFFVVGGFFTDSSGQSWSVVKRCTLPDGEAKQLPTTTKVSFLRAKTATFYSCTSSMQFLRLTPHVRKVGFLHDCFLDGGCTFDTSSRTLTHSTTTLAGGTFLLMTRYMCYPPRRS